MISERSSGSVTRTFFIIASISGCVGVGLGAFGAHALRDSISPELLGIYETGVRYQLYHVVAIFATAWLASRMTLPSVSVRLAGWCFTVGTTVFSGSLYLLVLTEERWLGAVTPIGGLAFIGGWIVLAWSAWRLR